MKSEVDPQPLHCFPTSLALPRLASRNAQMTFHTHSEGDALELAPFGFRQPSQVAPTGLPDVVLTPLLGFDRAGNRLGQGAGHYDRYFASHPNALRIGLAWSVQEIGEIANTSWDMPLDAIQTELEWIVPKQSRLTS